MTILRTIYFNAEGSAAGSTPAAGEQNGNGSVIAPNGTALTGDQSQKQQEQTGNDQQKTPEQLAAEQLAAEKMAAEEKAKKEAEEKAKKGAPEKYEEWKVAEGLKIDEAKAARFSEVAKELNLSQEQAQKLVDLYGATLKEAQEASTKAWQDAVTDWGKQAREDKEIGGVEFDQNVATALKAVNAYGNDAFKQLLNDYGLGNHPEVIRFMVKAGKEIGDATVDTGGKAGVSNPRGLAAIWDKEPAKAT